MTLYIFTKNDFGILRAIYKRKAVSELVSVSVKTLQEDTKLSSVKIRSTLTLFLNEKYIKLGFRKVNAKTVYIVEDGINKLKEIMGGEIL